MDYEMRLKLGVYGVIYSITHIPSKRVYVGKTIKTFTERYSKKWWNTVNIRNIYLKNAINKYGHEEFEVNECLDVAFSKDELNLKEMNWIREYKSYKQNHGFNATLGGEGNIPTEKTKKLMSDNSPHKRQIVQLSIDGKFINEYSSVVDTAKALDVVHGTISEALKSRSMSVKGYIFLYKEEYKELINNGIKIEKLPKKKTSREVVFLDKEGVFIKKCQSVKKASEELGITHSEIRRICLNNGREIKGYKLMYYDEYEKYGFNFDKHEYEHRNRNPIVELDPQFNFIREYKSAHEAAEILNITVDNVYNKLYRGTNQLSYTNRFMYVNEYSKLTDNDRNNILKEIKDNFNHVVTNNIEVIQLSKEGEFIAKYDSANEAARALGVQNSSSIRDVCNFFKNYKGDNIKVRQIAYNYIWFDKDFYDYLTEYELSNIIKEVKLNKNSNVDKSIKSVLKITNIGKVVKEYRTMQEAANDNGISKTTVRNICEGKSKLKSKNKSTLVFKKDYYGIDVDNPKKNVHGKKKVVQINSVTGALINTFDSIEEAKQKMGFKSRSGISEACTNYPNRTAGGYKWCYLEKYKYVKQEKFETEVK